MRRTRPLCTMAWEVNRLPSERHLKWQSGEAQHVNGSSFLEGLPTDILPASPLPIHPPDQGQKDWVKMTTWRHHRPHLNPSVAARCTEQEIQNPLSGLSSPWSRSPGAPPSLCCRHAGLSLLRRRASFRLTTYTHSLRGRGRILWGWGLGGGVCLQGLLVVCPPWNLPPVSTICSPQSLVNYEEFRLRENPSPSWTKGARKTPKESTIPKLNV